MSQPGREKIPFLPQILSRPGWLISFLLDGGLPGLPNVMVPGKGPMPLVAINAALAKSAVNWPDLRWIRELWRGPIVDSGAVRTMEFFAEPIETPSQLEKLAEQAPQNGACQ